MLNKDDKEYLKNNVEKKIDDIDRKIEIGDRNVSAEVKKAVTDPNSHFGKKLKAIYDKQNEKDDRDKYIDELLTKKDKGEATLAEKVELIKASLDKKLPDDFKDGMKAMTDTMKKGGSQAMQGISHLTGRIMMSNPLTAMLWENRDILKAVGDIGLGGLKMGAGLLGAVGKGTAGILKASVNLFKKKKKQKIEDSVPEQDEVVEKTGGTGTAEEITDEKSSAQKITEIHDLFFKGDFFKALEKQDEPKEKEARNRQSVLSKGLAGIGKTMQVISGVIETIMAKQKLILGGLMIGAMGILALVDWINDGGLEKLLKSSLVQKTKDKVKDKYRDFTGEAKVEDYKPTLGNSINTSILTGKEYTDYLKDNSEKFTGIANAPKRASQNNKEVSIGQGNLKEFEFKTGNLTPVLSPFDGTCVGFKKLTVNNDKGNPQTYFQIDLYSPSYIPTGSKQAVPIKLRFDYVINPKITNVSSNEWNKVSRGDIIGYSDGKLKITELGNDKATGIINDYGDFVNKAAQNNFKENIDITNKRLQKKGLEQKINDTIYQTIRDTETTKYTKAKLNQEGGMNWAVDPAKIGFKKLWQAGRSIDDNYVNDRLKEIANTATPQQETSSTITEDIPKVTKTPISKSNEKNDTDEKVKKQEETLKGLEEKRKEQETKDTNSEKLSQNNVPQPIVIPSGNRDNSILPAEHVNDLSAALMLQA